MSQKEPGCAASVLATTSRLAGQRMFSSNCPNRTVCHVVRSGTAGNSSHVRQKVKCPDRSPSAADDATSASAPAKPTRLSASARSADRVGITGISGVGDDGGAGVSVAREAVCAAGVRVGTIGSGVMVGMPFAVVQPITISATNGRILPISHEKRRTQLVCESSMTLPEQKERRSHEAAALFHDLINLGNARR